MAGNGGKGLVQGGRVQPRRRFPGLDQVKQDLAHLLGFGDHRQDAHRGTTVAADQGIGLVDLRDQPGPCCAGLSEYQRSA